MKKKLFALLLVVALITFPLSGCWLNSPSGDNALTLSWDFNVKMPVFEKVAEEYKKLNPGVEIVLDQKDGSTYTNWLSNQLSMGEPTADIVIAMGVNNFFNQGKFVDLTQYLNKPNPYADNQVWKTLMDPTAYEETPGATNGQVYTLNTEQVITAWYYNKDMFDEFKVVEQVGKEPTEWNWDDFVKACEIIDANGKVPLAVPGDYSGFWSYQMGWMYRVYTDQYFRDMEPEILAVPGDWNYDEELQTSWFFDPEDKFNDAEEGCIFNEQRLQNMIMNDEIGPNTEKYKDMIRNISRVVPKYVPAGFTSLKPDQAAKEFIQGNAAIMIEQLSFYAGLERTFADNDTGGFEVGVFRYPPMTGELVGVDYTRDTGGARGSYAIISKNREKTQLAVDFLMYFFSPVGQTVYLNAMAEENIAPSGVPLIHGVEMPEQWQGKYDFEYPGSADGNKLGSFSRGYMDYAESVRDYVESSQKYFGGNLTLDEYVIELQENCKRYIPYYLRSIGYRIDAWETPALNPIAS